MIKRVLITSLVIFVIALFIFWLMTGGWAAASRTARSLANPLELIFGTSTSGSFIKLPWQPGELTRGPDIGGYASEAAQLNYTSDSREQTPAETQSPSGLGAYPSPYAGRVRIMGGGATESDPSKEFVEVRASGGNTTPILVTNWSLVSTVSGVRATIPQAAPTFVLGVVNAVQPIYLEPGGLVFIATAAPPVGTSFRENICSGYLSEVRTFTPELPSECPAPSGALPMTAENLQIYGSSCFDFLNTVSTCHSPTNVPSDISANCRSFVANTLSYNGCVSAYRGRIDFLGTTYRAYLALHSELWSNSHDVIRLLDEQGRTVDVLTY